MGGLTNGRNQGRSRQNLKDESQERIKRISNTSDAFAPPSVCWGGVEEQEIPYTLKGAREGSYLPRLGLWGGVPRMAVQPRYRIVRG